MPAAVEITHSCRRLAEPKGWVMYLSHDPASRLVVFVHGFLGRPVRTWQHFAESGQLSGWWRASDMLFVGYDSGRETVGGVANRLRRRLSDFYPVTPQHLLTVSDISVRPLTSPPYGELVLVGHSLGGLVIRRALCDTAKEWVDSLAGEPLASRPAILDAQVRLFSPASAGFRGAGKLGLIEATPIWALANVVLRQCSTYTDCLRGSEVLVNTRRRTEELVNERDDDLRALRARILWANPDNVVVSERYDSDYVDAFEDNTTHSSVCKPHNGYETPRVFVETGRVD